MTAHLDHEGAMDCILGAAGVTALSYEEAIDSYCRLRGFAPEAPPAAHRQGSEAYTSDDGQLRDEQDPLPQNTSGGE
jgi:hypothetical protein